MYSNLKALATKLKALQNGCEESLNLRYLDFSNCFSILSKYMNWLIHLTEIRIGSDAPPQMRLTTRRLLIDDHLVKPNIELFFCGMCFKNIWLFVERWCYSNCSLRRTSKTWRSSDLSFEGFRSQISEVPLIYASRHTFTKIRLTL